MRNPAQFFADKKITVMGIDPNGRGLQDALFLAEAGADIVATDLKEADELQPSVEKLKGYNNVELVLGEHRLQDFENKDFIIRAASVPLESPYLQRADEQGIPIEVDETLFLKYAPEVTFVGVTGTRGKSTVTHMITHILSISGERVHCGGNVRGASMLPKLMEVKQGDVVVMELSSWQLQGFGHQRISPEIAVFTTFMEDHLNYYADDPDDPASRLIGMQRYFKDKSHIFRYQHPGDVLIVGEGVAEYIEEDSHTTITEDYFPRGWQLKIPGAHNRLNASFAIEVARELGVSEDDIRRGIESFGGVEGRLEYLGKINGVAIYNDNNATTQDATIAAIEALSEEGEITLVAGGADKQLKFDRLAEKIQSGVAKLVLLHGSATEKLKEQLSVAGVSKWREYDNFKEAIAHAFRVTEAGAILLFSPAAASFNMFENEHERNDQFKEIVMSKKEQENSEN